jgi:hypothetical protein
MIAGMRGKMLFTNNIYDNYERDKIQPWLEKEHVDLIVSY